ncbi:hypothetical protein ACFVYJ_08630 [Pontibacter sp. JAM-7]|uniref:hypothetical protein n=1 Tax=Pontibacter sp. JAM-7 TaxID=3366581 RepID=UPI003AF47B19
MDALSIFIIAVSVVLAIAFKWFLFHRIQQWMDQDLINGLAEGNTDKQQFLQQHYHQLRQQKIKRRQVAEMLTQLAAEFEQKQ